MSDLERLSDATDRLVDAARRVGASDPIATDILSELDRPRPPTAIVVVGETKRGKSSVVNALIGRPGLSPVAVDVATATYIVFASGDDEAYVRTGRGERRRIDLADLPAWTTVDGLADNPAARVGDGEHAVNPVEVLVSSPLLDDLTIVDTPGVGGLDGDHALITREAVRVSASLLFVTDITAPLTAPEAAFLADVTRSNTLANVIVAANCTDKLTDPEVPLRLADLRGRLDVALGDSAAEVDIVAVSASLAAQAASGRMTDAVRRRQRERSGLDDLVRVLHEKIAGRGQLIGVQQRAQLARDAMRAVIRAQEPLVVDDGDPYDVANDLQDALEAFVFASETARMSITTDLDALRRTLSARIESALTALSNEAVHAAAAGRSVVELEATLAARIGATANEIQTLLASGVNATVTRHLAEVTGDDAERTDEIWRAVDRACAEAAAEIATRSGRDYEETPMSADAIVQAGFGVAGGVNVGTMLGRLLGLGGAGIAGFNPLALIFGATAVGLTVVRSKRVARITETRSYVSDRISGAHRDLDRELVDRVETAKIVVAQALRMYVRDRRDQVRTEIRVLRSPNRRREVELAKRALADARELEERAVALVASCSTAALPEHT